MSSDGLTAGHDDGFCGQGCDRHAHRAVSTAFAIPTAAGQENVSSPDADVQDLYLFMDWKDLIELYTHGGASDKQLDGHVQYNFCPTAIYSQATA